MKTQKSEDMTFEDIARMGKGVLGQMMFLKEDAEKLKKLAKRDIQTEISPEGTGTMKGAISMSEQLAKRIYDESNGLWYELHGDYYLPCITIDDGPTWPLGECHREFLRECRKNMYDEMVLNGRLHEYLLTINDQAEQRMELLIRQMQDAQGVNEQLKAAHPIEWVERMNNIRACAREIVEREIICA